MLQFEMGAGSGQRFKALNRFGDKIVRTRFETERTILVGGLGSQHQNGETDVGFTYFFDNLHTSQFGEHEISDNGIIDALMNEEEPFLPIFSLSAPPKFLRNNSYSIIMIYVQNTDMSTSS